jgi:hypothetical protein
MEAQPARVDAAMIKSAPAEIQTEFLFSAIGTPIPSRGVPSINWNQIVPLGNALITRQ